VPKEVIINMKGPQMVWVPKDTWKPWVWGLGRLGTKKMRNQACKLECVAQVPRLR
jgi:hypothetical protein